MKNKKKVIIIGANSHIAKGLIYNFAAEGNFEVFLYTTNEEKTKQFIKTLDKTNIVIKTNFC